MLRRLLFCSSLAAFFLFCGAGSALAFDLSLNSQNLILVNQTYQADKGYAPADLQNISGQVPSTKQDMRLRPQAAQAYIKMVSAMQADGINNLSAVSAFRSYNRQTDLFNGKVSGRQRQGMTYTAAYAATAAYTAIPGTSEHQTGLTLDVSNNGTLTEAFAQTKAGQWLAEHAWEYGFILRFPKEKEDITKIKYEPWHFRYVGMPHSQIIYEKDWCLEEYIQYLHDAGQISLDTGEGMTYDVYWTQDTSKDYVGIIDVSSDNTGGYVITTYHPTDVWRYISGHWAEENFQNFFQDKTWEQKYSILPDGSITRADFAILLNFIEYPETKPAKTFQDVKQSDYYYAQVMRIVRKGLMDGDGDRFYPTNPITREEAASSIATVLQDKSSGEVTFTDMKDISSWALPSVRLLAYQKIMQGDGDGAFRPKDELTWAETVTLLLEVEARNKSDLPTTVSNEPVS